MPTTPPLSLQLYTVREALEHDFDATIARVAAIGFRHVEPFNFVATAPKLAAALAANGLTAPSTHFNFLAAGTDLDEVFAAAAAIGIATVIEPHVPPERWASADDIRAIAAELNAAVAVAARHGVRIGYHNHAFEFANEFEVQPGIRQTGYELFAANLDPAVILELDTYWAAAGGQDVPALLARLGDRVRFIHIKDGPIEDDSRSQVAVGAGMMPIWDIIEAAKSLEYGVVELDDTEGDMFTAVEDSYAYLTGTDK
ncbi:sugar phosphate isomerase/epimerase family protein [Lacisediminihabitans changchengi]|uniref:TIM barrel protein n=1 Tax=Lacisediminihabitans changchengi TaxID=2787634 RepID=A0A934W5Z7_9MICO|nr:TIM barrel protein [Lacisediminihabitans changchengi]MBK4349095.1 TIM barrel protein [Lacisediminihabitans changchengi]